MSDVIGVSDGITVVALLMSSVVVALCCMSRC